MDNAGIMYDEKLSLKEFSLYSGLNEETIIELSNEKGFPGINKGSNLLISKEAMCLWTIERHKAHALTMPVI